MLELVAFAVAAGCLLGLSALTVVSLLAPERRLWPAGDDNRKRRGYLTLSRPLLPAVFATGVPDWNAGPLAASWHLAVGAVGILTAFAVLSKSTVVTVLQRRRNLTPRHIRRRLLRTRPPIRRRQDAHARALGDD